MDEFKYTLAPLEDALDGLTMEINKIKKRLSVLEDARQVTISNHTGKVLTVVPFGQTVRITAEKE